MSSTKATEVAQAIAACNCALEGREFTAAIAACDRGGACGKSPAPRWRRSSRTSMYKNRIVNVRGEDSTVESPSGSFGNQRSPALPLLHLTRQLSRPVEPGPDGVGAVGGTRPWRSLRCRHLQGPVESDLDNLEDEELRDRCSCDGRADKGALEAERDLASVDMESGSTNSIALSSLSCGSS